MVRLLFQLGKGKVAPLNRDRPYQSPLLLHIMAMALAAAMLADPERDGETIECFKETTRNILETIRFGQLHDSDWEHFLVASAQASCAKQFSKPLAEFKDVTVGALLHYDANTAIEIKDWKKGNLQRGRQLRKEIPQLLQNLTAMAAELHYQPFGDFIGCLVADLERLHCVE